MNTKQQFDPIGAGVALVTPFTNDTVDYDALKKVIEHVIKGGVDYVVSLGSTGETATLSFEEQIDVVAFTKKTVDGRVPVVVGMFAGNNTAEVVDTIETLREQNFFDGIAAILSSSPEYNKPTQEGIYQHFKAISEASPVPIILYTVPGRTCSNIEAETTVRLARDFENIIGIKDATCDMVQAAKVAKYSPAYFRMISGDDPTALAALGVGAQGVISVIANAYPEFSQMVRHALNGEYEQARALHYTYIDIHPWLYIESNPVGLKAVLEYLGLCTREVRLPLLPFSEHGVQNLTREMDKIKK